MTSARVLEVDALRRRARFLFLREQALLRAVRRIHERAIGADREYGDALAASGLAWRRKRPALGNESVGWIAK